jgi:GTPase SAR1 family protein
LGTSLIWFENRKVPREAAENFAKANSLLFRETSTFTGENVREVFEELIQSIYQKKSRGHGGESEPSSQPANPQMDVLSNAVAIKSDNMPNSVI